MHLWETIFKNEAHYKPSYRQSIWWAPRESTDNCHYSHRTTLVAKVVVVVCAARRCGRHPCPALSLSALFLWSRVFPWTWNWARCQQDPAILSLPPHSSTMAYPGLASSVSSGFALRSWYLCSKHSSSWFLSSALKLNTDTLILKYNDKFSAGLRCLLFSYFYNKSIFKINLVLLLRYAHFFLATANLKPARWL